MEAGRVQFDIRRYSRHAVAHSHPHHQLVLPIRGRLEMEIAGRGGLVDRAQAAVVAAGTPHSFAGSADNAFLIVDVASEPGGLAAPHEALWDRAAPRPFVALDAPLRGLCAFLAAEVERQGLPGPQGALAGELLLRALARRRGLPERPLEPVLARAIALMRDRIDAPLPLDAVARRAGLSVSRLHALFRARLGTSPQRYLATLRLARAARLLAESGCSVAEIALAVGYADQSAFTRAFRRAFGQTPGAYRRTARAQESRHNSH